MRLRIRLLAQTLSASAAFTLLLGGIFFLSMAGIRRTALLTSRELGNRAANIGSATMKEQMTDTIARIAAEVAVILDEKLLKIENHTRMVADIAGAVYTHRDLYRPHPLPFVVPGQMTPAGPYVHTVPGVELSAIRREVELAGNIENMLRQIVVVDPGIITSTIGGEAGYIIAMDAYPWPSADFDSRNYPWYLEAKRRDGLYWTGAYLDLRGRGPAVSCAIPLYDQSGGGRTFKGVARSTVVLAELAKIIDSAKVGKTGYLFLLDQDGMKIFSEGSVDLQYDGNDGLGGENYLESGDPRIHGLGLSMTLGASGMTELELDGLPVYAAYAPIRALGWSLGVVIPVQEIFAPVWLMEDQIMSLTQEAMTGMDRYIFLMAGIWGSILLGALALAAFFSIRFTASITGPILALNECVWEVSGGNLNRELSIKTGDELEQLADSFNTMTGQLREHIAETARAAAEKERIATELNVATQIQTSMLPYVFPPFPNRKKIFDLYAMVHPAKEVGGDFYDFFFIDEDRFAVVIADVSGKGIPAALFMAITKTLIKNRLQTKEDPAEALGNINRELCTNNAAEMFVTLWLGVLDISSGRLSYINAGHNPPLIKAGGRGFAFIAPRSICAFEPHYGDGSPPDLFLAGMKNTAYHTRELLLRNGDTLLLYTDGVTEAADTQDAFYGKRRLREFLDAQGELPVRELLEGLLADIETFTGGAERSDDITLLALRINQEEQSALRYLALPADTAYMREALGFIREILAAASCPDMILDRIELAAEEVFVNIANYAYKAGSGGDVVVGCGTEPVPGGKRMTLSFTDRGEAFNPLDHQDPDIALPLEKRPVGGLGILIVKQTMDTIEYRFDEGANRLILKKSW